MNLIEQIQTGKANSIISSIEKQLGTKLLAVVTEERKRVAALSFGIDEEALNEASSMSIMLWRMSLLTKLFTTTVNITKAT